MTAFDEFAERLGYAELAGVNTGFYFHGCVSENIGPVLNEGLRVDCSEPCFSCNPASALLKYANPGLNSNNVYSGKVWDQIAILTASGRISYTDNRDILLQRATDYWRTDPTSGAALAIDLSGYEVGRADNGGITLNGRSIEGGITKWMYAHLTIEPGNRQKTVLVEAGRIAGYLMPSVRWQKLFERYHPARRQRIPPLESGCTQAMQLMASDECYRRIRTDHTDEAVAFSIINGAAMGLLFQELRKAFLGLMAAGGMQIIKNDFLPACEWPTTDPGETDQTIRQLDSTHYNDKHFDLMKESWLTEIREAAKAGI